MAQAKKKDATPKGRTPTLPGIPASKVIAEVTAAGLKYQDTKEKRMRLTKQETDDNQAVADAMNKHNLKVYKDSSLDPPLIIRMAQKVKVSWEKAEKE